MKEHEKRIRDFLSERSNMRGLCPEQITGANDNHLNVSDLRALLADLDAMRGALEETLLFCETFSNRWDGQTGAHPFGMVERARAALKGAEA